MYALARLCTPAGNRTRIKGLGNLRSIHLTTGAACPLSAALLPPRGVDKVFIP